MAGEIRQKIHLENLTKYIQQNVPEIQTPLDVKQFGYGQSNPTYLLTSSNPSQTKYVMRKQPPGQLLSQTAHRVDREYRIIHALQDTDVPVPRAICLCEDPEIIGTPFYIMQFLDGRIFEDPAMPEVQDAQERREMWKSAVETLGKFHRVKPESVGLGDFGRKGGFYSRQLKTFARLSEDQARARDVDSDEPVGQIPHYEEMVAFFAENHTQPRDKSTCVHGDYKIDNLVFHPREPRVIGVLDWEMATLGHPLSDLTNLIMPFSVAEPAFVELSKEAGRRNLSFLPTPSSSSSSDNASKLDGLPTKEECIQWYENTVNETVDRGELAWAEAFGIFRGSVIIQGIAARYARRQASSERAMAYGGAMRPHARMAWEFVKKVKAKYGKEGREGKARL